MKQIQVSYSLLNTWHRGDIQGAVNLYLHRWAEPSPEALYGREWHQKVQDHLLKSKVLLAGDTRLTMRSPEVEKEVVVQYQDYCRIKGLYDVYDKPDLYELKTGKRSALQYASDLQVPLYLFIAELSGIPIERAFIIHFDQYKNVTELVQIWNDKDIREKGKNLVDTLAPEIYQFFKDNGILEEREKYEARVKKSVSSE